MAKSKMTRNGKNKKLHSKLIKQKKDKLQQAKDVRKAKLREIAKLAKEGNEE